VLIFSAPTFRIEPAWRLSESNLRSDVACFSAGARRSGWRRRFLGIGQSAAFPAARFCGNALNEPDV